MASTVRIDGNHKRAVIVGAGNIGSHLVEHQARAGQFDSLLIVDPDRYDDGNLRSQRIVRSDVGKAKASVQARYARRIRPGLRADAVVDEIGNVPLGLLQCDLLFGCLDSRLARMQVNEIAWRMGIPWVDGGVRTAERLARVSVYYPDNGRACMECGWGEADYAEVEAIHPCTQENANAATDAPAYLGALTASLQSAEAERIASAPNASSGSRRIVYDSRHHRLIVSQLPLNPDCRFDHSTLSLSVLAWNPKKRRLQDLLALSGNYPPDDVVLSVPGHSFAASLLCECGFRRTVLILDDRLRARRPRCGRCGSSLEVSGFDCSPTLCFGDLRPRDLRRSLAGIGIRVGDVVTIRSRDREAGYVIEPEAV
jgi:molybdopterin/thiamine biosynthesis adenylyltransferase